MANNAKSTPKLHARNKHQSGYDLKKLSSRYAGLKQHIFINDFGKETIEFSDPKAVFELNKSILLTDYKLKHWEIAKNSLCPAIPGRADYVHYMADLLASENNGELPKGPKINILDIGTGSSLIYPLIGAQEYEWKFVGTEIDRTSIHHAEININKNVWLKKQIDLRFQDDKNKILAGIIYDNDKFDVVMGNPPYYGSREEHWKSTTKKFDNLNKKKDALPVQNFGGHANELWYEGGEKAFISKLIYESMEFKKNLNWITSLVSNKDHLKPLISILEYHKASKVEVIEMKQGQKTSRILAWKW
ncbi:23S rRNA (adenine(1618)-N(6))-methyltransferase RlmF [Sphingobacterium olei]|uniref:23S rRNA (Adenine(1618)-N(6))-methyltransferase RlmF n=1 Tax=Sphingobacterium olei TaxID=2571155 RepID=A0A4U0NL51_9SPHI|nr:23S rRNA (adenine(1618)-N(6))-methyltransferase RlmF [Sphingobacterium olei]TJZ54873.1 23S rRNA (adenine(1618)-N(6))-methyltransferase RlmF [Sphingobacterium olei]